MSSNPTIVETEIESACREGCERAIELAGGQTALAERLSMQTGKRVRQSRISMWLFRGRIPHDWVIPVETVLTALGREHKRYDIRPDLYPRDHDA